jgi:hypothetical protein
VEAADREEHRDLVGAHAGLDLVRGLGQAGLERGGAFVGQHAVDLEGRVAKRFAGLAFELSPRNGDFKGLFKVEDQVEQVERRYITRIDGFLRRDSKTLAVREMKE